MSRHDGVSCDSCMRNNFKGRRYKCLVCFDYDLCGTCFEAGAASGRHLPLHAMQCILPKEEYELYYSGDSSSLSSDAPLSFTCPYCSKLGLTEITLYDHVCCEHTDATLEVVCPICASQPGGEPNNLVSDFVGHVQRDHRIVPDDGHLQSNDRQPVYHIQPRPITTREGHASSSAVSRGSTRRVPFGSVPLSPREPTMENITEILSQLSAAGRRAHNGPTTSTSAQQTIQHLQMQDRQHSQARQQLDKVPRRGPSVGLTGGQLESVVTSSLPTGVNGAVLMPPISAASADSINSQYLLSKFINETGTEKRKLGDKQSTHMKQRETCFEAADRAQFVENLLLTSLLPNSSLWKIRSSQQIARSSGETTEGCGESMKASSDSGNVLPLDHEQQQQQTSKR